MDYSSRRQLTIALVLASLAYAVSVAQSTAQPTNVHVSGKITDQTDALVPGVEVTFENGKLSKTVTTNDQGSYEADLPPGDYVMNVHGPHGFRIYHRPTFRLQRPRAVLNGTLLVGNRCGDMVVVNKSGEPVTKEQWETAAAAFNCLGEEEIAIPSATLPLALFVRYGTRSENEAVRSFIGEADRFREAPVFVDYNLFSLHSDKVTYDLRNHVVEGIGHAVAVDGLGTERHGDTLTFKLEDGEAAVLSTVTR
jgi:hypothetical protein